MAETEVYLFTGPEAGEKNEAIENLRDAASKKNNGIEQYKYYAADVRIEDIVAQLQNASLFSPALFISLRNAEQIKQKSDIESLVSWIKASKNSPNTLVLISEENSIDKKLKAQFLPATRKFSGKCLKTESLSGLKTSSGKTDFLFHRTQLNKFLKWSKTTQKASSLNAQGFSFALKKEQQLLPMTLKKFFHTTEKKMRLHFLTQWQTFQKIHSSVLKAHWKFFRKYAQQKNQTESH